MREGKRERVFAGCTLNKPIVIAVMGTDDEWQWGEVSKEERRKGKGKECFLSSFNEICCQSRKHHLMKNNTPI